MRALIEEADLLEQLTQHPGWAVLLRRAERRMEQGRRVILEAEAKDWEQYLRVSNSYLGAQWVLDQPGEAAELANNARQRLAAATRTDAEQ